MKQLKAGYRLIHKQPYGSKIYGTQVPDSDIDIKGVYVPTAEDILLCKVQPNHNFKSNNKGGKNSKEDIDEEYYSLQEYLRHLVGGQTVALDMLFTPWEMNMNAPGSDPNLLMIWKQIIDNKDKFIHSGVAAFAGYARGQANRYGIRGSRLKTARVFVELLKEWHPHDVLKDHWTAIEMLSKEFHEHSHIITQPDAQDTNLKYLEVCNRKAAETVTVKYALTMFEKVVDEYGKRSQMAATNDGSDIKAYYHAIRVSDEAIELLTTGKITLPRPNADFLLKIRNKEFDKEYLSGLVDERLVQVEEAMAKSLLPKEPDLEFVDKLVSDVHRKIIEGKL